MFSSWRLWIALSLVIVVGAYLPAFEGDFVWDDDSLIVKNRYIKSWSYLGRNLTSGFWDVDTNLRREAQRTYYRPLITLSYMVDHSLWGLSPRGFHFTNLLMHLVVVLLFSLYLRRLVPRGPPWIVGVAALLFALHPSRAEAVFWVSGRTDLLMAIFALAALLGVDSLARRFSWGALVAALAAFVLALGCKESAAALLVVFIAHELLLAPAEGRRRRAVMLHLPVAALTVAFVVFRLQAEGGLGPSVGVGGRALMVLASLGHYAALLFWPYAPDALRGAEFSADAPVGPMVAAGAAALVVVAALVWRWRREHPAWAFSLLFCAATLAPAANLVTQPGTSLVAERFTYLPMAGVAWCVALVAAALYEGRARAGQLLLASLALAVASWAPVTFVRGGDFASPERFWEAARTRRPELGLPLEHLARVATRAGKLDQAAAFSLAAVERYRARGEQQRATDLQLALVENELARLPSADEGVLLVWASQIGALLELARGAREAEVTLSLRRAGQGGAPVTLRFDVTATSRRVLAARAGDLLTWRGALFSRLGRDEAALRDLRQAHAREARSMPALLQLALAELRALRVDEARAALAKAQDLAPKGAQVRALTQRFEVALPRVKALRRKASASPMELAELQLMLSAPSRAARLLRRVVAANPQDRQARGRLIMVLALGGAVDAALKEVAGGRKVLGDEPGLLALEEKVKGMRR